MEEKEEEYIRRGVEREKGCGLSPGCWPSHPPLFHSISPSIQPLLGCLLLHNGCFSAEISRYWIPSLEFCPPTMSRQQSMLQGKHTLQAKSWKTIPSFISIRKTPPPPPTPVFHLFSLPISPSISKPEEACQAWSSFTRPLWPAGLLRWEIIKISLGNKHKVLIPIRFYRLSSDRKAIRKNTGTHRHEQTMTLKATVGVTHVLCLLKWVVIFNLLS